MNPSDKVTFSKHINGLVHTIVEREGDDVTLRDPRGRLLRRVPIEHLVPAPAEPVDPDATVRIEPVKP